MTLVTGTPLGNVLTQEALYIEGAPQIYIQDYRATPLFNPGVDGYYWNMSGTTLYPSMAIGCVQNVSLTEDITMNDVRCDMVGVVDTIQKRNFVDFNLEIISLFPLSILRHLLNLSPATVASHVETVGIPQIDQTQHYMVYAPKIYDETNAYWLMFHLHKAKFVDAWTIDMTYGEPWKATGLKIRAYADQTKPAAQLFGVIRRMDSNAL